MRETAVDLLIILGGVFMVVAMVVGVFIYTDASIQSALDRREARDLRDVFPDATSFSPNTEDPPYFKAYKAASRTNGQGLAGFAFYTTDLEPRERGYEGPIAILVGMTLDGTLTGIKVTTHSEPYGYFSIETGRFHNQFKGKSILDRFQVGRDVDAISRATITVSSAARVIRKSARRMARQYLSERGRAASASSGEEGGPERPSTHDDR